MIVGLRAADGMRESKTHRHVTQRHDPATPPATRAWWGFCSMLVGSVARGGMVGQGNTERQLAHRKSRGGASLNRGGLYVERSHAGSGRRGDAGGDGAREGGSHPQGSAPAGQEPEARRGHAGGQAHPPDPRIGRLRRGSEEAVRDDQVQAAGMREHPPRLHLRSLAGHGLRVAPGRGPQGQGRGAEGPARDLQEGYGGQEAGSRELRVRTTREPYKDPLLTEGVP